MSSLGCNHIYTTTTHGGNKILNGVLGDVLLFILFVADGSFDELCDPGVLLGINMSILLAMVRDVALLKKISKTSYSVWPGWIGLKLVLVQEFG